jgi:hypothetical protein
MYRFCQENFKVHNISFTENCSDYAPSPSKYRMPSMFSAKHDQDHRLHVRGEIKAHIVGFALNSQNKLYSFYGYIKIIFMLSFPYA